MRRCDWCKTKEGKIKVGSLIFCSEYHAREWKNALERKSK